MTGFNLDDLDEITKPSLDAHDRRLSQEIEKELFRRKVQRLADARELGIEHEDGTYFIGSLQESLETFKDSPRWLVDKLLPYGITLLHGKSSLGKTPFGWHLAQAVATGSPFLGHEVKRTGNVLWLEADEHLQIANERLAKLEHRPDNITFVGVHYLDILNPVPAQREMLQRLNRDLKPVLVVMSPLRRCHLLDDKESTTPEAVYRAFRQFFPNSALLFIHHDKKTQMGKDGQPTNGGAEAFSGSAMWKNLATYGIHMTPRGQHEVRVKVDKSQVGCLDYTLDLTLEEDGVTWAMSGREAEARKLFDQYDEAIPKMERYEMVAKEMGIGQSTLRRLLKVTEEWRLDAA
jgi:hypothetical protein